MPQAHALLGPLSRRDFSQLAVGLQLGVAGAVPLPLLDLAVHLAQVGGGCGAGGMGWWGAAPRREADRGQLRIRIDSYNSKDVFLFALLVRVDYVITAAGRGVIADKSTGVGLSSACGVYTHT